jgi:predicted DNA-binding transcriptional regulator AlpA
LPWADIPEFIPKLKLKEDQGSRSAAMLHLVILTVCRTNEIRRARPEEFDLLHKIWTIPSKRMKMGLPHRVPLCDTACDLAKRAMQTARYGYLFPGDKKGAPLSNMAMLELPDGMGYSEITVHGFRSTFQDWAEEYGEYPEVLADKAIAHKTSNKARRAYQRGDMLERRRKMMDHWSQYCAGMSASVVSITPPKENPAKQRLIRLREVRLRVGLGTSTVYRYLAGGKFPRPVQIGGGRVAWLETDVDAWIVDRVEASGPGAT